MCCHAHPQGKWLRGVRDPLAEECDTQGTQTDQVGGVCWLGQLTWCSRPVWCLRACVRASVRLCECACVHAYGSCLLVYAQWLWHLCCQPPGAHAHTVLSAACP